MVTGPPTAARMAPACYRGGADRGTIGGDAAAGDLPRGDLSGGQLKRKRSPLRPTGSGPGDSSAQSISWMPGRRDSGPHRAASATVKRMPGQAAQLVPRDRDHCRQQHRGLLRAARL